MIIVVGVLQSAPGPDGTDVAGGRAAAIARSAARSGAVVQLVGKIGDDPPGDLALLSLAADGIGHAAVLRDASHPTGRVRTLPENAGPGLEVVDDVPVEGVAEGTGAVALDAQDLELGLRYLADFRVLVLAEGIGEDGRRVATEAASFNSAHLVAVLTAGSEPPVYQPLTALEAPESDTGDEFAALVGRYAAALDDGTPPDAAFRLATGATGWEPTPRT